MSQICAVGRVAARGPILTLLNNSTIYHI